jgi:hypothetical protein
MKRAGSAGPFDYQRIYFFAASLDLSAESAGIAGAGAAGAASAGLAASGAGAGAGAGAGVGAVAGAGGGAGGGVSCLPQAARATTIIEARRNDLFMCNPYV